MKKLTSLTNPLVKDLVRLQRESSQRRERGLFVVESERDLRRAIDAGFRVRQLFVAKPLLDVALSEELARGGTEVVEITDAILHKAAYREHPEGFIAVLESRVTPLAELSVDTGPIIVCSGLEKPGNIGAILRTADAAGAAAMLIDQPEADVFNPNVIRASTGAVFAVPIVSEAPEVLLAWLRKHQVRIIAATPEAAVEHTAADLTGRCALVLGAEAQGLSEFWKKAAEVNVVVPMRGRIVASLNVSVTAAVLMYEALRQRELKR